MFIVSPFIGLYSKIFKDVKWLTFSGFALFAAFFGETPFCHIIVLNAKMVSPIAIYRCYAQCRTRVSDRDVDFPCAVRIRACYRPYRIDGRGSIRRSNGFDVSILLEETACALTQPFVLSDSATVSATVISSRSLGGSVGLAICEALCIADELQQETDAYTFIMLGTAIFSTRLSTQLPAQIASHVLPLGFNPQYLGQLIGGLSSQNIPAVMAIPGISPEIIAAGVVGLKLAFIAATKYVWVVGIAITGAAAVVCLFIENLSQEYTAVIDHPVELKMETEISHKESS